MLGSEALRSLSVSLTIGASLSGSFVLLRLPAESEDLLDEIPAADTRGEDPLHVKPDRRSFGQSCPSANSEKPMMAARTLLKSWAIPPASVPTASIFCAWRSCCSTLLRSSVSSLSLS